MDKAFDQSVTYLDHAKERMQQRGITPREVEEALSNATATSTDVVPGKISLLGTTAAGKPMRLMRLEHFLVIVSVVSLEGPSQ
ncbi:MAG: DUF4258 domain-containing protein [Actinomycetota bacterium]